MNYLHIAALTLALASGSASAAQSIEFRGDESVFGVVAVATAKVVVEPPFLRVAIDRGIIRATPKTSNPKRITGFRINLVHALPSGGWDAVRKSERVPLEETLDHPDSAAIVPRTLTIPIDGIDNLRDTWLVFEVDADGAPPGFTYSHSQKLTQE